MDDREWMYRRMRSGRMNPEYITGVRRFINFAYSIERNVSVGKIRCPCVKCKNQKFQKEDDVCYHLLRKGFLPYYKNWTVHGEPYDTDNMVGPSSGGISRVVNDEGDANPYRNMVLDAMRDDDAYYNDRVCSTVVIEEPPNLEASKFFKLLKAAEEPLWDGTFVDNRSKTVVEKYRNEMVARYGPDQDNHPSFDGAAWCEASGGISKGRVYGAPHMPKSKVDVSSSSHSYSVHSSYPSTATRGYQEQFEENREVINEMRTQISSIQDCLKLLVGHMGLSMPTPVAPSMPSPTMAPVYRPRPRPRPRPQMPYNGPSSSHQQHRRSFPP